MNSEKEIVDKCISTARYILNPMGGLNKNVEFTAVKWEKKKLIKLKKNTSFTIYSPAQLLRYQEEYINEYKRLTGSNPQEIVIKNCAFQLSERTNRHDNIVLDSCLISLSKQSVDQLVIKKIINSEIIHDENANNINVKEIINSYSETFLRIVASNNPEDQEIRNSIFINKFILSGFYKFNNCEINNLITYSDIRILSSKILEATFNGGAINFISIYGSTITNSFFNEIKFRNSAIFIDTTFINTPIFTEIDFTSKNVEFKNVKFLDRKSPQALGTYRSLTQMCLASGYEHGAIFFHGLELETYYNLHLKDKFYLSSDGVERFNSNLHKLFTDYGRNLLRPILWLFLLFTIGLFYNSEIFNLRDAALFSLKHSLGPLFFALPESVRDLSVSDNDKLNIIAFLQTSFSAVLWFLIIFMVRRRFKI